MKPMNFTARQFDSHFFVCSVIFSRRSSDNIAKEEREKKCGIIDIFWRFSSRFGKPWYVTSKFAFPKLGHFTTPHFPTPIIDSPPFPASGSRAKKCHNITCSHLANNERHHAKFKKKYPLPFVRRSFPSSSVIFHPRVNLRKSIIGRINFSTFFRAPPDVYGKSGELFLRAKKCG